MGGDDPGCNSVNLALIGENMEISVDVRIGDQLVRLNFRGRNLSEALLSILSGVESNNNLCRQLQQRYQNVRNCMGVYFSVNSCCCHHRLQLLDKMVRAQRDSEPEFERT